MILLSQLATAIVLGATGGLGLCVIALAVPRIGAPTLASRIAPYIRDVTDPRGTSLGASHVGLPSSGWCRGLAGRAAQLLGASTSLTGRLAQAGLAVDPAGFRARQLTRACVGAAAGGLGVAALAVVGTLSVPATMLPVVGASVAAVLYDVRLTARARARTARLEDELPVVLEFLALCLSAGESMLDALRRIGDVGAGELTVELRAAVLEVDTGSALSDALSSLASRLRLPGLTRSIEHLVAALDRGAPLAHVLQAQAADARDDARRALIESAGRKEIAMLLPLVFLILPLSVLFAVFPGVQLLRLGLG